MALNCVFVSILFSLHISFCGFIIYIMLEVCSTVTIRINTSKIMRFANISYGDKSLCRS